MICGNYSATNARTQRYTSLQQAVYAMHGQHALCLCKPRCLGCYVYQCISSEVLALKLALESFIITSPYLRPPRSDSTVWMLIPCSEVHKVQDALGSSTVLPNLSYLWRSLLHPSKC